MENCTGLAGIWIALTAGIFIGDEILKGRMEKRLSGKKQEEKVLKNKILLRLYHNYGAMLDLGQKRSRAVAITSVLLTLFLSVVFLLTLGKRGSHTLHLGLSLLLGGAYSNTYDRLKRGYVVDYFSFGVKWRPLRKIVFNLSDFCIMTGAMFTVLAS